MVQEKDYFKQLKKRYSEMFSYDPKKGKINEGFGDVDTSRYVCVGEIPYTPWYGRGEKVYIMVDPVKTLWGGREVNHTVYTEKPDGTGLQTVSIPVYAKRHLTIYPEYQDTEFGEMFLGKRKSDDELNKTHQEFMGRLFVIGNNVIIHHNSSYRIMDGFVRKGKANNYSNNSDIGIYFWGSRNSGNDQSNIGTYTYYCKIQIEDLYDFQTNSDRISLDQALENYKYVGQNWKNGDAIVINTLNPTPIWCILDKLNGKWYDKEWNEIEKPF